MVLCFSAPLPGPASRGLTAAAGRADRGAIGAQRDGASAALSPSQRGLFPARARSLAARASSAEPAPAAVNEGAGSGTSAEASEPVDPVQRVADDPVLKQRAIAKQVWVPPKMTLGEKIVDVLFVYGALLDRPFGSGQSIAAAGSVVVDRIRSEINGVLPKEPSSEGADRGQGEAAAGAPPVELSEADVLFSGPEGPKRLQLCFEILRIVQLLTVDLEMVKVAVKEETLLPRLEAAKERCKLAMTLAKQLDS